MMTIEGMVGNLLEEYLATICTRMAGIAAGEAP